MDPTPTLEPLLMIVKPLTDILTGQPGRWEEIAKELEINFPIVPKEDKVYNLCTAYYACNRERLIQPAQSNQHALITEVVDFVESFMTANNQWAYLKKQPWYENHKYVIGIDVNYYPNRAQKFYKLGPQFHKDTGGNNIFVNLIFANENPIEATEWFVDVEDPGGIRAAWQEKLLPKEHLDELASLRLYLKGHPADRQGRLKVEGGVVEGRNICASWVDDLIWHATPSLNERIVYTAEIAKADYKAANKLAVYLADWTAKERPLDYQTDYGHLSYKSTSGRSIHLVELIGTIADIPGTKLVEWLKQEKKRPQDIDCDVAIKAWIGLYLAPDGQKAFEHDVALRGAAEWRMTGYVAEATAYDERLEDDPKLNKSPHLMEPTGMSKIRRVNSGGPEDLKLRLKQVAEANNKVARRFIRTWVRILPTSSDEVKKSGLKV
jgi:hypothetical protein